MKLFKRAVIISLFFLIGSSANAQDLTINADNVDYDKEKGVVEASGNVVVEYKGVTVEAPHLTVHTITKTVFADDGFVLKSEDRTIYGQDLDYNFETRSGEAKNINMVFNDVYLEGSSLKMDTESISLSSSSFTTCNFKTPHYSISALSLTLYPEDGLLFAYLGWFHVLRIPLIPVPTYVYDLKERGRAPAPLPEFGSNDEDGWYVIEKVAWHSNSKIYGNVSLSYAEKKGPGGGIDSNFYLDDDTKYYARIYTAEKDGYWGGLSYTKYFGEFTGRNPEIELPGIKRKYGFELNISSRERINYERVSLLPDATLFFNKDYLIGDIKYDAELSSARIFEESTQLDLSRNRLLACLTYDFPETSAGLFTVGTSGKASFYSDESRWGQVFETLDHWKKVTSYFGLGFGYKHIVANRGQSPFAHENYLFRADDVIYGRTTIDFSPLQFGVRGSYYLPSWDPKDIDYTILADIHCFSVIAQYRALRNEVEIGLSLSVD